ncbi:ABC transporter ATP-binding protein [Bifidobacterium oedipodis]|uniref:ABC transporter n=1 Tax=Bifidobacterium oedipodis TaxID=2675322 RepID=A0A7Y0EP13_9BIFI|nr:ABC transporter ATP-binding protein [Bifidobacterium sp. DSM 109957]NMM93760.1 ABC transporter [Bifidobacterium sp. DSM 109957]
MNDHAASLPLTETPIRVRNAAHNDDDHDTPLVTGTNVGHRFKNGPWLFSNLNFTLHTGEAIGLCGPSGSGKSTLLSIIAGFDNPSKGTVTREHVSRIRWVFQNPHGMPKRTAIDHVVQPLLGQGLTREQAEDEAVAIMSMFRLTHVAAREFSELSGGEAQRLMLARAIASKPDLLLVDEPTAQLDQHTANDIDATLTGLAQDDVIVIIATHDSNTRAACSRVIDLAWHDSASTAEGRMS